MGGRYCITKKKLVRSIICVATLTLPRRCRHHLTQNHNLKKKRNTRRGRQRLVIFVRTTCTGVVSGRRSFAKKGSLFVVLREWHRMCAQPPCNWCIYRSTLKASPPSGSTAASMFHDDTIASSPPEYRNPPSGLKVSAETACRHFFLFSIRLRFVRSGRRRTGDALETHRRWKMGDGRREVCVGGTHAILC